MGPANLQSYYDYVKTLKVIKQLQTQHSDFTYNPLPYMNNMIEKIRHNELKPFAVYLPGEQCPDLIYNLVFYFPKLPNVAHANVLVDNATSRFPGHSGVKCINDNVYIPKLSYSEMTEDSEEKRAIENDTYNILSDYINSKERVSHPRDTPLPRDCIHIYLCSQFLHSIYPTPIIIFNLIEQAIHYFIRESFSDW
jgi:hypothetical protein